MALPTVKGELITEGLLYRFIPNLDIYWEYDRDRPSPRAFRRRSNEGDVSMYLDGLTTVAHLADLKPEFGIYSIRVERLLEHPAVSVIYDPDPMQPEGIAKVAVLGINRARAEWIARQIGERVKPPAAAVKDLAAGGDDR